MLSVTESNNAEKLKKPDQICEKIWPLVPFSLASHCYPWESSKHWKHPELNQSETSVIPMFESDIRMKTMTLLQDP